MFGYNNDYDIPLEAEAVDVKVQLERMELMFGLTATLKDGKPHVTWNEKCRFALVIFSVVRVPTCPGTHTGIEEMKLRDHDDDPSKSPEQVPWTFEHEERPNAPATLLQNTLSSTRLRAWDF